MLIHVWGNTAPSRRGPQKDVAIRMLLQPTNHTVDILDNFHKARPIARFESIFHALKEVTPECGLARWSAGGIPVQRLG